MPFHAKGTMFEMSDPFFQEKIRKYLSMLAAEIFPSMQSNGTYYGLHFPFSVICCPFLYLLSLFLLFICKTRYFKTI